MEPPSGEYSTFTPGHTWTKVLPSEKAKHEFQDDHCHYDILSPQNEMQLENGVKSNSNSLCDSQKKSSIDFDAECSAACRCSDQEESNREMHDIDRNLFREKHSSAFVCKCQVNDNSTSNINLQKDSNIDTTTRPHNTNKKYHLPYCQNSSQNPTRVEPGYNCHNNLNNKPGHTQHRKSAQKFDIPSKKKRWKRNDFVCHSIAKRNTILLAKKYSYKPNAVFDQRHASDNFYSALFTLIFCCFPLGLASLIISCKVRTYRADGDYERAQQSSLLGRKLSNTGIMLGMCGFACALFYFLINLNIPYVSVEYSYYLPEYNN